MKDCKANLRRAKPLMVQCHTHQCKQVACPHSEERHGLHLCFGVKAMENPWLSSQFQLILVVHGCS